MREKDKTKMNIFDCSAESQYNHRNERLPLVVMRTPSARIQQRKQWRQTHKKGQSQRETQHNGQECSSTLKTATTTTLNAVQVPLAPGHPLSLLGDLCSVGSMASPRRKPEAGHRQYRGTADTSGVDSVRVMVDRDNSRW